MDSVLVFSSSAVEEPRPSDEYIGHRPTVGSRSKNYRIEDPDAGIGLRPTYSRKGEGSFSPRHRHNFEQIR